MTSRPKQLLPDYRPPTHLQGGARVLRCCYRNVEVRASKEERVRQRVLHWLLIKKAIARSNIRVEETVRFTNRTRGRADIVVCDTAERPLIVVECKRPGSTGYDAETQAIRYARRLGAQHVWITDGSRHRILACLENGSWREKPRLPLLRRLQISQVPDPPPAHLSLAEAHRYLRAFKNGQLVRDDNLVRFATSVYRLILGNTISPLPYSWRGLHILEDRGVSWLSIKTPGAGRWESFYRILLVATEGRVETTGIGFHFMRNGGAILCVAVLTPRPAHHALQLDVGKYCRWNNGGSFDVYHDGRLGGRSKPRALVLDSLRESGRGDLLKASPIDAAAAEIHLGRLPGPQKITWTNSRVLVANLLYYGMIRHTLRRARPYSFAD